MATAKDSAKKVYSIENEHNIKSYSEEEIYSFLMGKKRFMPSFNAFSRYSLYIHHCLIASAFQAKSTKV